jgi:hypothetical protein
VVIAAAPDADWINSSATFEIKDGTNGLGEAQFLTATEVDTTPNPEPRGGVTSQQSTNFVEC